jgi:uncharacterized protein (DUF433 family)
MHRHLDNRSGVFAGVTVEEAIRAVEAQVRSPGLLNLDEGERFAPIVCVFASFYESTKDELSKTARLWIIASVLDRVLRRRDAADILSLRLDRSRQDHFDWKAPAPFSHVRLREIVQGVVERMARLARATECVSVNPEVMGGTPVFVGTRLPVDTVAASRAAGATNEEIIRTYAFLTPELIEHAEIYQKAHPRHGPPQSLGELNPTWKLRRSQAAPPTRSD